MDEILMAPGRAELPPQAIEHLASCEKCRALVAFTGSPEEAIDSAVMERVHAPIVASLTRVRPLASASFFTVLFLCVFAVTALVAARWFGIYGLLALNFFQQAAIYGVLLALAIVAAWATARDMRPGARTVGGGLLFGLSILAIEAVFLLLIHNYSTGRFLQSGLRCFRSGLLCAAPAALVASLIVSRGYVVAPVSTGAAVGALAGLAGVMAQELFCPLINIPHVVVWHGALFAISVGAGAFVGWIVRLLRTRESP